MNLDQLHMDPEDAREKLAAARRQIKRFRYPSRTLPELKRGYEALAAGTPVSFLRQTIGEAGWDDHGRPRLAIARSDRQRVRVEISGRDRRGTIVYRTDHHAVEKEWSLGSGPPPGSTLRRSVPRRFFAETRSPMSHPAVAVVPLVPPDAIERAGYPSLRRCFTLWEAEWEDVPADPALLRHLGGDLYAVLAVWDLTELERAVLRHVLGPSEDAP